VNAVIPRYCLLTWVEKHFTHDKNHPVNSLGQHTGDPAIARVPYLKKKKNVSVTWIVSVFCVHTITDMSLPDHFVDFGILNPCYAMTWLWMVYDPYNICWVLTNAQIDNSWD
jgi:hypothetical protein